MKNKSRTYKNSVPQPRRQNQKVQKQLKYKLDIGNQEVDYKSVDTGFLPSTSDSGSAQFTTSEVLTPCAVGVKFDTSSLVVLGLRCPILNHDTFL